MLKFTLGDYEHGKVGPLSFEQMRAAYAERLKATVDHFGGEFLNEVHGVYVRGTEVCVAETGITPNSPANADLLAAAPAMFLALNAQGAYSNHQVWHRCAARHILCTESDNLRYLAENSRTIALAKAEGLAYSITTDELIAAAIIQRIQGERS